MRLDETAPIGTSSIASEVSVMKRQIQLRRISTEVRERLYLRRDSISDDPGWKEREAARLNDGLEAWKETYAATSTSLEATSIFETVEYLLVNFHRERINIFAGLAIPMASDGASFQPNIGCLRYCLQSSMQIISLYQRLAERGISITSW